MEVQADDKVFIPLNNIKLVFTYIELISSKKLEIPRNISCKDGHNKWQKQYGSNRSRRYEKEVARIHRRTIQKGPKDADIHDGIITHLEPDILECKVK